MYTETYNWEPWYNTPEPDVPYVTPQNPAPAQQPVNYWEVAGGANQNDSEEVKKKKAAAAQTALAQSSPQASMYPTDLSFNAPNPQTWWGNNYGQGNSWWNQSWNAPQAPFKDTGSRGTGNANLNAIKPYTVVPPSSPAYGTSPVNSLYGGYQTAQQATYMSLGSGSDRYDKMNEGAPVYNYGGGPGQSDNLHGQGSQNANPNSHIYPGQSPAAPGNSGLAPGQANRPNQQIPGTSPQYNQADVDKSKAPGQQWTGAPTGQGSADKSTWQGQGKFLPWKVGGYSFEEVATPNAAEAATGYAWYPGAGNKARPRNYMTQAIQLPNGQTMEAPVVSGYYAWPDASGNIRYYPIGGIGNPGSQVRGGGSGGTGYWGYGGGGGGGGYYSSGPRKGFWTREGISWRI